MERTRAMVLKGKERDEEKERAGEIAFMTVVACFSIVAGFATTITLAKKRDPTMFAKGLFPKMHQPKPGDRKWMEHDDDMAESGGQLALRALRRGTLYAFAGVGAISYGIWKLVGASDIYDFRMKVGAMLPVIPKNSPPQGRTEFDSLTDLLQYVIDEDERIKKEKSS